MRDNAFVHVHGTHGAPYAFGDLADGVSVEIRDFYMGVVPVTQELWRGVMGEEEYPALHRGPLLPMENISWSALTRPGGFLERLNGSAMAADLRERTGEALEVRLPTETEWEYAARGGPHWRDAYRYSGGDDIDAVAWYDRRHGDHTQPVGQKASNQLGIHDMSGNVWEWCQDTFSRDVRVIPRDGTAYEGAGEECVLRGGCFHNWAMHCTVSKRYEMGRDFHDGCIGVRLVAST